MAEFSYINTVSATTGIMPSSALYGQHPPYTIKLRWNQKMPTPKALKQWPKELGKSNLYLYTEIKYSQAVQAEQADQHHLLALMLQMDDKVLLLWRRIQTTRPSSKLDIKWCSRFKLLETISTHTYKLVLSASMKCHNTFHVLLLEPTASNPLKGEKHPPTPPIFVDDEQEYEAEEVVNSKLMRKKLHYQVQ